MSVSSVHQLQAVVEWRDLVVFSKYGRWVELMLPVPWLLGAWVFGYYALWLPMAICVMYVFVLGLRVAHGAIHHSLGVSRGADHAIKFVLSLVMLGSSHAIAYTHRYHHSHCLEKGDVEGQLAHSSFWQALWRSPAYPVHIHIAAWMRAKPHEKHWIIAELTASVLIQIISFLIVENEVLMAYTLMMLIANILAPMVGIWAVHREGDELGFARSCRHRWINALTCGMFYHAEHHAFPAVPTSQLSVLAKRIDTASDVAFKPVITL